MTTILVKYAGPNRRQINRRSNMQLHKPNRRLAMDRRQYLSAKPAHLNEFESR